MNAISQIASQGDEDAVNFVMACLKDKLARKTRIAALGTLNKLHRMEHRSGVGVAALLPHPLSCICLQ